MTLDTTVYEDSVESQPEEEAAEEEKEEEESSQNETATNEDQQEGAEEAEVDSVIRKYTMKSLESDIEASNKKRHWITDREMTLELQQVAMKPSLN